MARPTGTLVHAIRHYSYSTRPLSVKDRLGATAIMGYCCIAFSAPFAGAAEASRRAGMDESLSNMRPLSFRDCTRCSPLDDYVGFGSRKS